MSYAVAAALQQAVYSALTGDPVLEGLVGEAIYDAAPSGSVPALYVSLGPETARARNDATGRGAEHLFTISVIADAPGFAGAKSVAAAVCDVLQDANLPLTRGRLVSLQFRQARAAKIDKGSGRKIDLVFRARVED